MTEPHAEALAAFRRFNYDHIYMRPDSLVQSASVIRVLRALVEHFAERPAELPGIDRADRIEADSTRRCARPSPTSPA